MNPDKIPPLLAPELIEKPWSGREAWRVFAIIAEFAEATERLNGIRPAVSIFGSARTPPGHPDYALTEPGAYWWFAGLGQQRANRSVGQLL